MLIHDKSIARAFVGNRGYLKCLAKFGGRAMAAVLGVGLIVSAPARARLPSIGDQADATLSPPPFTVDGKKAVFIDITTAVYDLSFDMATKTASAQATIVFSTSSSGNPLFDSVATPTDIKLDGQTVSQTLVASPDGLTQYRMLGKTLNAGQHTMIIKTPLTEGVAFDDKGPRAGFFFSDVDDRYFLERYLPANLEFDQYAMTFLVSIINSPNTPSQDFFTNGTVAPLSATQWQVSYPSYFTASSLYFHTAPKGVYVKNTKILRSVSGKDIPIFVYCGIRVVCSAAMNIAISKFKSLEMYYGPWLHSGLMIYALPNEYTLEYGGMEYRGATISKLFAIEHEMTHSYFGRGVMPADGDAGWMDEAITTWVDAGSFTYTSSSENITSTNMANRSSYYRTTDLRAYDEGFEFIKYLSCVVNPNCLDDDAIYFSLSEFLSDFVQTRAHASITTQDFQTALEAQVGYSLQEDFDQAVYNGAPPEEGAKQEQGNPYHKPVSPEALRELL